jgi:hypothetical protein
MNRPRLLIVAIAIGFWAGPAMAQEPLPPMPEFDPRPFIDMPVAVLQALDKVTARVSEVSIALDQKISIGSLKVTLRACRKTPPEEQPEVAAFIEVSEELPGQLKKQVFQGWMFQSSPGLSAIEHPIYDVWVVDCKAVNRASSSDAP